MRRQSLISNVPHLLSIAHFQVFLQVSGVQLFLPPCFHTRLIHKVANEIEKQNGALLGLTYSWYNDTHWDILQQKPG